MKLLNVDPELASAASGSQVWLTNELTDIWVSCE